MQFITAILALAATAFAAPNLSSRGYECTFGQYACSHDGLTIKQCDITGHWVEVGPCAEGEICGYSDENDLPYCFSTSKRDAQEDKRAGNYPVCSTPGTYTCSPGNFGIDVCTPENQVKLNGWCPKNTHCAYLPSAGGIPFCVKN